MKRPSKNFLMVLLGCVLLSTAAGCSGGANDTSSATPSAGASVSSPSASFSAPASEEAPPTSETPADPPAASVDPGTGDPRTGKVTAVRLADPLIGWTGGNGWIARTDDGGKHWKIQYRHPYVVMQIFALNAERAWATLDIGDNRGAKLIRTTDGGAHWEDAGVVPSYAFIHFVSEKEGFSGSARTTDGGKTWQTRPAPAKTVGDVYFHDADNGWAVVAERDGFSVRRTTDGGRVWRTVMTRDSTVVPPHAVIRSAGKDDAWVMVVGDSGMSQTSYSLFHTKDGGRNWQPVLANSGAGSGPAPGFAADEKDVPKSAGNAPGTLYVVNRDVAFMGAQCRACDKPNTIGKTTDGGRTWINLPGEYPGYETQQIAAADARHVWWINTDGEEPSRMYVTSDGGQTWTLVHTFDKPVPGVS